METPPTALPQIVVADDDADMRAYIGGALRGRAVVYEAADGEEALQFARSRPLDLIVSDLRMPGLGGIELCHALRADARTRSIPVLMVSGETCAAPSCVDGFLQKPFNAAGLRAHVERLLAVPL